MTFVKLMCLKLDPQQGERAILIKERQLISGGGVNNDAIAVEETGILTPKSFF